ncbi:glycosyl transferase [Rhodobacteraceae bacterium 2CG4]|uniref:Peptide O-xylosyltransferase n=1 Tax=Halovulum marinum TaxID=2662447 RepID=A0A6L5Z651_9RHOB|nr:beta-1,6-N-acetylglucosaminyltransferase [Halovulum marinum]MSU91550.1 glycosyl transferase [Halovulum marinum]
MIGVVLLAHEQVRRTAQLALHMARHGCRVALHLDARVQRGDMQILNGLLLEHPNVVFVPRRRCHWGTFSLVDASLDAVRLLLDRWPGITHVCQLSGSCLPIKPVEALAEHLNRHQGVDFIESVPVAEDAWVVDGLSHERFSLYHPLPWRRYRWLFDRNVELQRLLRVKRPMPRGLEPRIGSQWWCLSRQTLQAIMTDPHLPEYCRFFRRTWIPDESFFQSLAGRHSHRITSAPLTFVRFDPQGKPYVFYDDHLELLLQAEGFFARKVWRGANRLYQTFLNPGLHELLPGVPDNSRLLRRFERARRLHVHGRPGLVGHGRHSGRRQAGQYETARPYVVIDGIERAFLHLRDELNALPGVVAHGRLFGPGPAEFADGAEVFTGNLSANPRIRDHKPAHFLSKLVWAERPRTQVMLHDFAANSVMNGFFLRDPHANILRLSDGWLLRLCDLWRADRAALARELPGCLTRERRVTQEFGAVAQPDRVVSVSLCEVLRGGVALSDRLTRHMPEPLRRAPVFSGARLPADFGPFLADLADAPGCPGAVAELAAEVTRYDRLTRALQRKT